ncbi:MAG: hypothetical protein EBR29_06350, partial [Sphingobacteriia bacterium]|nr:hypothetical protein [Sphingobacteriia bacterium]
MTQPCSSTDRPTHWARSPIACVFIRCPKFETSKIAYVPLMKRMTSKSRLSLKLKQQSQLSPQQIMLMKLLHLPITALGERIQEELEIIQPVVDEFRSKGNLVFGPYPADGFFGKAQFKEFDGVLGMYHDQGLIPFKYIAFDSGVNFTAGLPVIRTSPDHGTAYDIAGQNVADPGSFLQA